MALIGGRKNRIARLGTQAALAPATTGANMGPVDVSKSDFLQVLITGTGGATASTDVDIFTQIFNAAGTVTSGNILAKVRESPGSLSGGNVSRIVHYDVRGIDQIQIQPRNLNATIPLDVTVDVFHA